MPVFEYGCSVCDYTVDVRHGVHGHGPSTCPVCGGSMRKLLSTPTIVFKGSGWASKEGRSGGSGRSSSGSSDSSSSGSSDSGSSDRGSSEARSTGGSEGAAAPAPATGSSSGSAAGSSSGD